MTALRVISVRRGAMPATSQLGHRDDAHVQPERPLMKIRSPKLTVGLRLQIGHSSMAGQC
jgi:hypothetical protein